jgi:hypothetical protein
MNAPVLIMRGWKSYTPNIIAIHSIIHLIMYQNMNNHYYYKFFSALNPYLEEPKYIRMFVRTS